MFHVCSGSPTSTSGLRPHHDLRRSLTVAVLDSGCSYVDGAVRSINNAASVASMKPDIVIVSAPLSIDRPRFRLDPMTAVRNTLRVQTALECRKLARTAKVVVIEPTRSDAKVMGTDLNAAQRRVTSPDTATRQPETPSPDTPT